MSKEVMNNYNQAFDLSDIDHINNMNNKMQLYGIGLWNVHVRIRLAFGKPYGMYIKRSGQSGTTVQMKLPLIELDNEEIT
ncbi:hypothetical protein ACI2OX_20555 [Bacillus sp. N9]